ncbi:MAG: hypothetical protein ACOYMN_10270 [Roseimicrobium sp.]
MNKVQISLTNGWDDHEVALQKVIAMTDRHGSAVSVADADAGHDPVSTAIFTG